MARCLPIIGGTFGKVLSPDISNQDLSDLWLSSPRLFEKLESARKTLKLGSLLGRLDVALEAEVNREIRQPGSSSRGKGSLKNLIDKLQVFTMKKPGYEEQLTGFEPLTRAQVKRLYLTLLYRSVNEFTRGHSVKLASSVSTFFRGLVSAQQMAMTSRKVYRTLTYSVLDDKVIIEGESNSSDGNDNSSSDRE